MSDRDNSRARQEALAAARKGDKGASRQAHEDALARFLQLQAEQTRRSGDTTSGPEEEPPKKGE